MKGGLQTFAADATLAMFRRYNCRARQNGAKISFGHFLNWELALQYLPERS
jgi:hypothetical protein